MLYFLKMHLQQVFDWTFATFSLIFSPAHLHEVVNVFMQNTFRRVRDAKTVFVAFYSVLLVMFEFVPINRSTYIPFS